MCQYQDRYLCLTLTTNTSCIVYYISPLAHNQTSLCNIITLDQGTRSPLDVFPENLIQS